MSAATISTEELRAARQQCTKLILRLVDLAVAETDSASDDAITALGYARSIQVSLGVVDGDETFDAGASEAAP